MITNLPMNTNIYSKLMALSLVGFLIACGGSEDKSAKLAELKKKQSELQLEIKKLEAEIAKSNPEAVVKAKEVATQVLQPRPFDHYVQTQGSIDAEENIQVSAKSMGVITQVFVREGEGVSRGQALAQIDNSVIVRNIEAMKSQLELANTVYNRQKNLWEQKIGTEVQYLQAKTNKESLEKQLASLQEQNSMTRITSPVSGTVDEVSVKVGENIAPGMPAVRVVNTSDLKVKARISEAFITTIKRGDKVVVSVPDINKEFKAVVTFVGKNIDLMSRTFNIEVKLPADADLRPNMTAIIKVIFHSEASTLVVPVNIIQNVNNERIVYVVETKGKQTVARKKVVTIDGVFDNLAQVKGLAAGDQIITVGYQGLNDGEVVKI